MSCLRSLTDLIGAQALDDHLTAAVQDLVDREQLARADAYRQITDAADVGDVTVLAATRQCGSAATTSPLKRPPPGGCTSWSAPAPACSSPSSTLTRLPTTPTTPTTASTPTSSRNCSRTTTTRQAPELLVEVLEMYRLKAWEPFELLLPTVAINNVRPQGERKS
jgi:hypothetical protein